MKLLKSIIIWKEARRRKPVETQQASKRGGERWKRGRGQSVASYRQLKLEEGKCSGEGKLEGGNDAEREPLREGTLVGHAENVEGVGRGWKRQVGN